MSEDTIYLREIRDLLLLIAEPHIADRDKKLRQSLRDIVGNSAKSRDAVLLMNGTATQREISKAVPIDEGQISRLINKLHQAALLAKDEARPKLVIPVSAKLFQEPR